MRLLRTLALLTGALLLMTPSAAAQSPSASPGNTGPENINWRLTHVLSGGSLIEVPAGVTTTLFMSGGQASGSGGCNQYGGPYVLEGASLTFGGLTTTEMACQDGSMAIETAYYAVLREVVGWSVPDGSLELTNADLVTAARFAADPGASLAGPTWSLTGYIDATGQLQPPAPGAPASITFDTMGQVSGSTGCNSFSGSYEADDSFLRIGPLAMTLMMCEGPGGEQEVALTALFERVASYALTADVLEMMDQDGNVILTWASAAPIEAITWVLTTMPGGAPVADGTFTTLLLADGRLSGNAPCNQYSGDYTLDGSSITIGSIVRTRLACPDLAQEDAYLEALGEVTSYVLQDDMLVLVGPDGTALLGFAMAQR
jgi:heat shock protein HslJ